MKRNLGDTSNIEKIFIRDSSATDGSGLTGLTSSSAGLIIATIASNEATPTIYTQASSNIETITTLGTYAAPTASKCRFKEIDSTNMPGWYELQFADARYAVVGSGELGIDIFGATNVAQSPLKIQLNVDKVDTTLIKGVDASTALNAIEPVTGDNNIAKQSQIAGHLTFNRGDGTLLADGTEQIIYENAAPSSDWIPDSVHIDLTNMAVSDTAILRVYTKLKNGGAYRLFDINTFNNVQVAEGVIVKGIPNRYGYKVTLEQTAGTFRQYDWERYKFE